MRERIGFLGLGIMGSRMAANIAKAGYELTVWTHTPGKAERWAKENGASAARTPAEVASQSDIVVSMVVDGAQVSSVLLDKNGVIEAAHENLLCVDMSTISPKDTRRDRSDPGGAGHTHAGCAGDRLVAESGGGDADDHGGRRGKRLQPGEDPCWRRWARWLSMWGSWARARC